MTTAETWENVNLEDVVEILDRLRVPLNAKERAKRPGEVPYYGATGQVGWIDEPIFDEELVLLGEDGAPFLNPNKRKAYLVNGPSWVNNHAHVLRAVDGVTTNRFLKYQLDATDYREHVNGTTRLKLTQKSMREMPYRLPPLAEQERVVAAIEEHFSHLDAAEASLQRARRNITLLRGRLIGRRLGIESVPGLDDSPSNARLPEGWSWMRAGDVCDGVNSGSTPPAAQMSQGSGEIPFIKVYNLTFTGDLDFTIKPTFVPTETHVGKLRRSRVRPGDVLINIVGPPLGQVSVVPDDHAEWNINQAIAAFSPGPSIERDFLALVLMSSTVMRPLISTGKATAGQVNLSITNCRRLWLPIPPTNEQAVLAQQVKLDLDQRLRTESAIADAERRSAQLRRAVLAAAFSGQLVPQDPADEPAAVLLDRIRADPRSTKKSTRKKKSA